MLKEGKMTTRELAAFFELSYETFRRKTKKDACLTLLHEYAEFEEVYGGIVITKVLKERETFDTIDYKKFFLLGLEKLPKNNEGDYFGTLGAIAIKSLEVVNMERKKIGKKPISESTLRVYYSPFAKELFGEGGLKSNLFYRGYYTQEEVQNAKGKIGWKLSTLLIKITEGQYRELTVEEELLFKEIAKEKDANEDIDTKIERSKVVDEILNDEYDDIISIKRAFKDVDNVFSRMREAFEARTGAILVSRGTKFKADDGYYYEYNDNFRKGYDNKVQKSKREDI